ncbi:helix-turn-helix domain-containing protein [Phaeobacter sp. B1627]|uniref:helix-turn-helix domain-containing protein n=1 Tax=Phaeobacter sp. B1627 TaxID=2583809 RepID=UPI001118B09A|nr:helix-turn-helix domain-containing protein [Phaeobacter sp. B1627]
MEHVKPYTADQLAKRWNCSSETVRQMVKRGELRGFRVGRMIRIPQTAVEEFECQTSVSEDCAAAYASTGLGQMESAYAVSLRQVPERRRKRKP